MRCERAQDAISAAADGEELGVDARLVEHHLKGCEPCQQFQRAVEASPRTGAVATAPDMPDLSRPVTKLAALADRASHWSIVRLLLVVVAVQIIVFSIPSLIANDEAGAAAHEARHLGAFTVAYGVALLVVVARPARARTVLAVAGVLAGALVITAIVDLVNGNIPLLGEALHIPEILSVILIWILASRQTRPSDSAVRPAQPHLTIVDSKSASETRIS